MAEDIERLGESTAGPGYLLLGVLSRCGWYVAVTHAFAGDGILVVAEHPQFGKVSKSGESVAVIAPDIAEACLALSAESRLH